MSRLSFMHHMGIENLGQPYLIKGKWYADHEETGERIFVPNRCCKCCITTDSQNDRFCDDCFQRSSFLDRYPIHVWILPAFGFFSIARVIYEAMK